jgi:hypothetical protein
MAHSKSTPIEPYTDVTKQPPADTGSDSAGQSGDLQGLPGSQAMSDESVRELIEEGQFFEASVVDGVENAPLPDEGEVRVHERREDDLRPEYEDRDPDEPRE